MRFEYSQIVGKPPRNLTQKDPVCRFFMLNWGIEKTSYLDSPQPAETREYRL